VGLLQVCDNLLHERRSAVPDLPRIMLFAFDPNWILYGAGVLVAVGAIRVLLRGWAGWSRRDEGPLLVFPLEPLPVNGGQPQVAQTPWSRADTGWGWGEPVTGGAATAAAEPQPTAMAAHMAEAQTVIATEPAMDGTIQLLPGRLEVVGGPEPGRWIPFVRTPGEQSPEITIGRAEGSQYRHVQLSDLTVSRMHARLRYESRQWTISNLSRTNPVRVNGRELSDEDGAIRLSSGDLIQVGAVELRYREGS
jgi:hypothetical protein